MNKYITYYNKIVDYYKTNINCNGYYEKHHITPKCLGGSDDISNLVLLPAKAHYVCHHLLHKAYPDNRKLAHAFAMMVVSHSGHKRIYTSRMYETARKARSSALKGLTRPEWVKEKLRKPKNNKENYKGVKSKKHRDNISKSLKGKSKAPEHVAAMVESQRAYQSSRTTKCDQRNALLKAKFAESGMTKKEFAVHMGININSIFKYLRD